MTPKKGDASPWGTIQHVTDLGQGVFSVSTAGHGGIYVPPAMLKHIPEPDQAYAQTWSGDRHWYEEDCAAAIPLFWIPGLNTRAAGGAGLSREEIERYYNSVKGYWAAA